MIDFFKSINFSLESWSFSRVIRLGLGLFFFIPAIQEVDYFAMMLGGVLLYQAIANTGCGFTKNSSSCGVDLPKTDKKVKL
ncbi:hypothetical protein MNBD_BACTEROID06-1196 [hydrothermal vent metagenome]|uniref:DUF2892 domain-containing protein n=1 Tax=hydrothermal vent metagenome TaxID=652676 RepID=A0A3B0URX6_9ZZZZ